MDQRHTRWRQFIDGLPAESRLGRVLLEPWRGCRADEEDFDSDCPTTQSVSPEDLQRRLEENRELMEVAVPNMAWANEALSHICHFVYLIDREGIVLHAVGNEPRKMADLGLAPGYDWSEAAIGRNGAGTALAEDRPVAVVGPEQIDHPLDDCTWTGAPLHAPDGLLIGAVGLSTCAEDGTPDRLVMAAHLANSIDQGLAQRHGTRRKDEFVAMLAHEIRNPLAPIRNSLHMLKPEMAGTSTEPVHAMMERQVDRLARLVDDLLDVSRISQDKLELRKEVVDLLDVVERAVENARPLFEQNRNEFTTAVPAGPIRLECDPDRLEQVLDNLLDNAIKFTQRGGRVALEVAREADLVAIRVSDTGIGISSDMLPQIFELYIQAGQRQDRLKGGLGIGLTLVRTLVEKHGGTVAASSEGFGLGSEFLVRLPALTETLSEPPPAEPKAIALPPRRRILVVDDNEDSARSMASLLAKLWHQEVEVAYDAASALELAESFHPEVLLLDIGLPGLSGYDLARALRSRPEFRSTLLVAISGWGQDDDRARSREAGIDHHLIKPVALEELKGLLAGPPAPTR